MSERRGVGEEGFSLIEAGLHAGEEEGGHQGAVSAEREGDSQVKSKGERLKYTNLWINA